ncbi:MAG: sulfonate ABC transporter permease, partial [Coxiella sp. RIFCSPHIGHO2_12_FULL_42_15]
MLSPAKNTYAKNEVTQWPIPNYWDLVALIFVIAIVLVLALGAHSMMGRFEVGDTVRISLNPAHLPYYALLTLLRMLIAMSFSLLFTFIFATWAAKSRQAERFIIPMIDLLQSVPVLGFLSIVIVGFIVLFRGSLLGPECAAIFAIFTAQAWNIALSFYQSLKMVPEDLHEASHMLQLSAWQKFWRVEVPFAMPGLIWNMMLSMSGSWIFLVASEAISVANHKIYLSGIGSYIAMAITEKDKMAILYVIMTMMVVIVLVDQILFRPLVAWSEKFKTSEVGNESEPESWLLNLFQRTRFMRFIGNYGTSFFSAMVNVPLLRRRQRNAPQSTFNKKLRWCIVFTWNIVLTILVLFALFVLFRFILSKVKISEIFSVTYDGVFTAMRVLAAIIVSSIVWVPLGVLIGLHAKATRIVQPIAQFLAAFPMNLIFPLVVWAILRFHLSVNLWVSPLMVMGSQWYILFNVIAGTSALPKNLHYAVGTLNVRGWLWWKRFILPGIFSYYITGAITAAGNAWNVSII